MNNKALIIIPAFNEEQSLGRTLDSILANNPEFDTLVINDGSRDRTEEIARSKNVMVLQHPFNMGYGATIQTGYKFAHEFGYDYVIQIDADGQHEAKNIGDLYSEIKKGHHDIILGSRFFNSGTYRAGWIRKIGMTIFKHIVNALTGLKLTDVTTGFQAMNRNVIREFVKDSFPTDYPDADILLYLHKNGLRIKEISVLMYPNLENKSMHSNPFSALIYIVQMIISLMVQLMQGGQKR